MPEGRFISRSISTSGQLKRVSLEADFLFGRCIPHLDRDGRLDGDPDVVKAVVCPLRAELTPELIATCLAELDAVGLVEWYEVDGQQVLWFPTFLNHQTGLRANRERPSRLPSHEAQAAKRCRPIQSGTTPASLPRKSGNDAATSPPKLSEVKSSKVKRSKDSASGEAGGWVAEGVEWWSNNVGFIKHGRFGNDLKGTVDLHGWPKVFPALKCYAEDAKSRGKSAKPGWFADDAVKWIEWAEMPATDSMGDLTPRGRAVLGVA